MPVLTRKGGVGKTTDHDAARHGPGRRPRGPHHRHRRQPRPRHPRRAGQQADPLHRARRRHARRPSITGFTDFSQLVSRDETRLDILASDTDPTALRGVRRERLQRRRRPRRAVLLDRAHRLRHRHRALGHAGDAAARRLDRHRLRRQRRRGAPGIRDPDLARGERLRRPRAQRDRRDQHWPPRARNLVKLDEIEAHFQSRVREIVRIPYDPQLAAGSVDQLARTQARSPSTRRANSPPSWWTACPPSAGTDRSAIAGTSDPPVRRPRLEDRLRPRRTGRRSRARARRRPHRHRAGCPGAPASPPPRSA